MLAIQQRHPEAVDLLFARYGRPAFTLARRILGDDGLAEDVVQDVFLSVWRDPGRYDGTRGGFASWLLSVTHHKAVDTVRKEESLRRRRDKLAEETTAQFTSFAQEPGVDEAVWSRIRAKEVREALRALPVAQREALALAYYAGYTQREVAVITGAPLGTVKTRMLTGMRRLAEMLRDHRTGEGEPR